MSGDLQESPVGDPDDGEVILTEAQHEYLKGWVADARSLLGLAGWHLELSRRADGETPNAIASTYVQNEADRATIHLSREWLGYDEQNRRITLIHEMLHPTIYRVTNMVRRLVDGELGHTGERILLDAVRLQEEIAVDRIAIGLHSLFPPVELPES